MNSNQGAAGGCTLGFNAVRNGVLGFVMNSHCTGRHLKFDGIRMYQDDVLGSEYIGKESVDPPYFTCGPNYKYACRYSDAAFITLIAI